MAFRAFGCADYVEADCAGKSGGDAFVAGLVGEESGETGVALVYVGGSNDFASVDDRGDLLAVEGLVGEVVVLFAD